MDWIVIMIFSLVGLIMGLLSIKGFTQKIRTVSLVAFCNSDNSCSFQEYRLIKLFSMDFWSGLRGV